MAAFDPPTGDFSGLNSAAALLNSVSSDLSGDLTATTGAMNTALTDWEGHRRDEFTRAGAGVQVQLKVAGDGCGAVGALMVQYANAFRQACEDVAEYKRLSDAAFTNATATAKTMDPSSTQYDQVFQHADRASSGYESDALAAKTTLATLAAKIATQIDVETEKVAPVSTTLTPDQIRRQVDSSLGLTGLTGTSTATMTTDQAWTLVVGAEKAIPADAVNVNGSVDWTKAFALPAVPPSGSDPSKVNAWWNSLSPTEQDDLLNQQYAQVGNLDGVPIADRDFANRINLPQLISSYQSQLNGLGPEPPKYDLTGPASRFGPNPSNLSSAWTDWNNKHTALQNMLDNLNGLSTALTADPNQQPPLYLIGVQAIGNGRGIVSVGNPDLAANVATYVPGMDTTLSGMSGGVSRSNQMYRSSVSAGASSSAVISWYGYDAPQGLTSAGSYDDAKAGAPLLDSFQNGLRLTHEGSPSLNTVVAHSYGTTLTGYAASHGNTLNADNVVFVASPGTSVDNVSDLRLTGVDSSQNGQHVYATVGQYDPIQLAAGINGPSPYDQDYGAHDFSADSKEGHWYELGWNPSAHSSYWDKGNVALTNMGYVIAGHGDQTQ